MIISAVFSVSSGASLCCELFSVSAKVYVCVSVFCCEAVIFDFECLVRRVVVFVN